MLVRIHGQAPIAATVYELEKLRCNLCGDVFTAAAPEEVGEKKYDETAASMMALFRYGCRFPWNRLAGLEESLGIPLPVATQCQIVAEMAVLLQPAFEELVRQAAQGELVHNDDTSMRVQSLERGDVSPERSGIFTSGLVWIVHERRIALFSPAPSTPAKIWPTCSASGLASCHPRFRCAMLCRGTCPNFPSRAQGAPRPCWRTVAPMAGATS